MITKVNLASPWCFSALVAVAVTVTVSSLPRPKVEMAPLTNPLRLGDLTLDRAIHFTAPLYGGWSVNCPVPASFGLAITELFGFPFHDYQFNSMGDAYARRGFVSVNEVRVASFILIDSGRPDRVEFDPPLIVRPGDVLSIGLTSNPINLGVNPLTPNFPFSDDVREITVGAWVLYPGEI